MPESYFSELGKWKVYDIDKDNKADFVILHTAWCISGEAYRCAIWKRNKKNKFSLLQSWRGAIVKAGIENGNMKITVQQQGCCDNWIICEKAYSYQKDTLALQTKLCYPNKFDKVNVSSPLGKLQTPNDSLFLFVASDSVLIVNDIKSPSSNEWYCWFNGYASGSYAILKPQTTGIVYTHKLENNVHWYFVVFGHESIQRRMHDDWIKSYQALKIDH